MSRCFPFPPPGYETNLRGDHTNSLKKDKHKEEQHKKERGNEKEEHKGRKHQYRSKEEHRREKDHEDDKDKHRDKDRARDKEKDKYRDKRNKDGGKKREKDRDKKGKDINNKKTTASIEKKHENNQDHNVTKFDHKGQNAEVIKDSRKTEAAGKRAKYEEREFRKDMAKNVVCNFEEKNIRVDGLAEKRKETGTEILRNAINSDQKTMHMGHNVEKNVSRNDLAYSFATEERIRDKIEEKHHKCPKGKSEEKEKTDARISNDQNGENQKDRSREKSDIKMKTENHMVKKKERDKTREQDEQKYKKQKHMKDSIKEQVKEYPTEPLLIPRSPEAGILLERNLKKKEIQNGFLHENDIHHKKLLKALAPSHHPIDNRKKLNSNEVMTSSSGISCPIKNVKVESVSDMRINGITDSQLPQVSSRLTVEGEIEESSAKPPHPDSERLSQILCVPQMEELPEMCDQEWLLECEDPRKKSRTMQNEVSEIWADAQKIESADILALPYVIPY